MYDLKARASLRRLTFSGRNQYPLWSRDGRYVAFQSDRDGDRAVFRQFADGSGAAERVTKPEEGMAYEPESWSPDGKTISLNRVGRGNQGIWTVTLEGDRMPKVFVDTPAIVEKHSSFSPDGRWIAYMSNTTLANANPQVFVQPFPPTGAKYQISSDAGRTPLWSADGKQIYYHQESTNKLLVADVQTSPTFAFGTSVLLHLDRTVHPIAQRNFDIAPDGKRLLVVLSAAGSDSTSRSTQQINVILNWLDELKQRVPVK